MNLTTRFEVVKRLGGGGMGDVFLARSLIDSNQPYVAVKRIRSLFAHDAVARARFEREATVSTLLRHPNIVSTNEYGVDDEGPYFIMDFVEGQSASDLLASTSADAEPLPLDVALSILFDVASALAFAHEFKSRSNAIHGIVHRDLSPDNILIGYDGMARLSDFGIARLSDRTELTGTGKLIGKSGYVSPEAYEDHPVDLRSDLFSFGATAFRVLSGVAPFQATTEAGMMRAVLTIDPPLVSALRPVVPGAVALLIADCLQKNPARRPESANHVAQLLKAALNEVSDDPHANVAAFLSRTRPRQPIDVEVDASIAPERKTAAVNIRSPRRYVIGAVIAMSALVAFVSLIWMMQPQEPVAETSIAPTPVTESQSPVRIDVLPTPDESTPPSLKVDVDAPKPGLSAQSKSKSVRGPNKANKATALRIRVKPYAEVFLDGRLVGQTPIPDQPVEPGLHSIILVNNELGVRRSFQLQARAGETKNFVVDLSK